MYSVFGKNGGNKSKAADSLGAATILNQNHSTRMTPRSHYPKPIPKEELAKLLL